MPKDYLCRHPRSHRTIVIDEDKENKEKKGALSLESFLPKDYLCSIRNPTGCFSLKFSKDEKIFANPHLLTFVEKYCNQIENLRVSYLSIPLGEDEWNFYEKLPKLKRISIGDFDAQKDLSPLDIILPTTFKNPRYIFISASVRQRFSTCYRKLIEHCVNLRITLKLRSRL